MLNYINTNYIKSSCSTTEHKRECRQAAATAVGELWGKRLAEPLIQ